MKIQCAPLWYVSIPKRKEHFLNNLSSRSEKNFWMIFIAFFELSEVFLVLLERSQHNFLIILKKFNLLCNQALMLKFVRFILPFAHLLVSNEYYHLIINFLTTKHLNTISFYDSTFRLLSSLYQQFLYSLNRPTRSTSSI